MNMWTHFLRNKILLLISLLIFSCTSQKKSLNTIDCEFIVEQGVAGTITWAEGNQMPSPNTPEKESMPVIRDIYIFPLINKNEVQIKNGLIQNLSIAPLKKIRSNNQGCFEITLSPGSYSLLTKEEGGFFSGYFDQEMNLSPVIVHSDQLTKANILINYKAVY